MKFLLQIIFIGSFLVLFLSCKKKNTEYTGSSISLHIEEVSNGVQLSWDKVSSSDFVRYEIFRSTSSIPDPTAEEPINSALQIGVISDANKTSFVDSLGAGNNYYRVQAVLKFRNLLSDVVNYKNGFTIISSYNSSTISKDLDYIYVRNNQGKYALYDYEADSLMVPTSVTVSGNLFAPKNINNQAALYSISGNSILEFNPHTINFLQSYTFPYSPFNSGISNGFLYLNSNTLDSLYTYNIESETRIDQIYCENCYKSSMSSNGNALIVTSTSSVGPVYSFIIGSDKKLQLVTQVMDNSFSLVNFNRISPNGKYIMTSNGAVLNQSLTMIGLLENPNFSSFGDFVFTDDENFVIAQTTSSVEVYEMNTFKLVKTIPTTTNTFTFSDIFIDGDLLIKVDSRFNSATGSSSIFVKKIPLNL